MYPRRAHRILPPVAIAAIGLILLLGPSWSGLPASVLPAPAPTSSRDTGMAAVQLDLARASLERGAAPGRLVPSSPAREGPGKGSNLLNGPPTSYYWNNLTAAVTGEPSLRTGPMMTYDASDGYVLLYGGANVSTLSDTWSYLNGTWTNLTAMVTGSPPPLYLGSMAYDPSSSSVILFGGENGTGVMQAQTWSYHALTWTNLTATAGTPPSPRVLPGMSTDSATGEVVLVGGDAVGGVGQSARDTWIFKDGSWTNVTVAAPIDLAIQLPTLADDPAGGGVLLTAAASNVSRIAPFFGATYLYKDGVWENLTNEGPQGAPVSVSDSSAFGYLSTDSAFFLGLGLTFNSSGSQVPFFATWEYAAGVWTNVTGRVSTGPQGSDFFASALLPGGSTMLLYGSVFVTGNHPATWALAPPPTVTAASSVSSTDVGVAVTFTGTVSGGVDPVHGAWAFGDGGRVTAFSASHTFATAGTYGAQFTATDLIGENATATATVVVNPLPTVAVSASPTSASAGSGIAFVAAVSGGTAPYTYAWTFGDGGSGTGAAAGHTYSSAGTFTATVRVTDAVGKMTNASVSVTVTSAPSTGTGFSYTSGTGLDLLLVIILLLVVAVLLAALLARKGGGSRGPPTQYGGATSMPPSGATGAPPPGGGNPPPPP